MSKTITKLIENLSGIGKVYKEGNEISTVRYNIKVNQKFIVIETNEGRQELPGVMDYSAQISVIEGERNLTDGSVLTLHLKDNRKWEFWANRGNPVTGVYAAINVSGEGIK